jgi:hypothetical protein
LQPLVTQQRLNAGYLATRIDQLRGERVVQHIGCHIKLQPLAGRPKAGADKVFGEWPVAEDEQMAG